jgi:hypothetical protein
MVVKQKPYESYKITDVIRLNKEWFGKYANAMFWSVGDGQEMEIFRIIAVALSNYPTYLTISTLYFLFGEKHILKMLHDKKLNFSDEVKERVYDAIELCKELEEKIENNDERAKEVVETQNRLKKCIIKKTYFGLEIVNDRYVRENDIKKLPFYEFWKESAQGSTMVIDEKEGNLVYLHDWIAFSKEFINNGTHRFSKKDK